MFIRIVKMRFQENNILRFRKHFDEHKKLIRNFEGCNFLELYQDKSDPQIFFTYSFWDSQNHLNKYRGSELFGEVWKKTKTWFSDKPEAWSVDRIESLS